MKKNIFLCHGDIGLFRNILDEIDQENDKKMRSEYLSAVSNFLQQAVQVQDPKMKPLLAEMLLFGTKGFKIGRDLETAFLTYMDDAKEQAETQAEADRIASMTYADKRLAEYPSIGDQLDDIYHNGIDGWKGTIKAIKDKYPKE